MHASTLPLLSILTFLTPPPEGWLGVYLAAERTEPVVAEVIPGSPAALAGLQAGDQLLAVGDVATPTVDGFLSAIRAQPAGSKVQLKIRRRDRESIVEVKLGERPEAGKVPAPQRSGVGTKERPAQPGGERLPEESGYLGIRVQETSTGLTVAEVLAGSPAEQAGVQVGELLRTIAGKPVHSLAELDPVLADQHPGQKLELGLQSTTGTRSLLVQLGHRDGQAVRIRPAAPPAPPAPTAHETSDLEREVQALREEIRQLRQQVEELRRARGRE